MEIRTIILLHMLEEKHSLKSRIFENFPIETFYRKNIIQWTGYEVVVPLMI